jgi:predicted alpha-1,6-mannanase (GH76 family)
VAEPDFSACAKTGINALQKWYQPATGLWQGTGWWNSANALTAVIRYTKLTGDQSHASVIATTFAAAAKTHAGFINTYYDDNAWWALAWVAAYDLTRNQRYLNAAEAIFTRNTAAWDSTCGGGLRWHTGSEYKNAITNELFITLAALLHQRVPGDRNYLSWAQRTWDWFAASGLINPDNLVNDGLTATCQNNGETTWTYNQGVILGGLSALFQITGDRDYLTRAEAIATATLGQLTAAGILTEPCESAGSACDEDQAQFKGIFVRYLYDFWLQDRSLLATDQQPDYRAFILANAASIWSHRNPSGQFGLRWAAPCTGPTPGRQGSALDTLIAAAALSA